MSLIFYRIGNFFHRRSIPILPKLFTLLGRIILGAYIPSSCSIGKRVVIAYGGSGLVIHAKAVIGDDCLLSPGVVIGGRGGHQQVPVLGDGVRVYPGAKILGPIHIGSGSVISVNAVVTRDVSPGTVMVTALAEPLVSPKTK